MAPNIISIKRRILVLLNGGSVAAILKPRPPAFTAFVPQTIFSASLSPGGPLIQAC